MTPADQWAAILERRDLSGTFETFINLDEIGVLLNEAEQLDLANVILQTAVRSALVICSSPVDQHLGRACQRNARIQSCLEEAQRNIKLIFSAKKG